MRQRTCRAHGTVTLILLSLALLVFPTPDRAGAQENDSANPSGAPNLDAESWAVVDRETGLYLAGKDPDRQVPIASTTKVMVALVALEDGAELDREVTVSENASAPEENA